VTHSPTTFPADFVQRLTQLYGEASATEILEVLSHGRPTTFRANTVKASSQQVKEELEKAGFELEHIQWLDAFVLRNRGLRDLEEQPLYQSGSIYVQGLSSMIPPVVLAPLESDAVLDIAAAPGSKTTQMAALMNNQGMILANDTSTVRIYKLEANIKKLGIENVKVQRGLGEMVWRTFREVFDKTLTDVPCSMEGRFNLQKPKTLENWSVKKIKELSNRQKSMLRSAISATQVGGTIVYSTCTLSPEENEGVVDWILKREAGKVILEEVTIPDELITPAILEWSNHQYSKEVQKTKRILPSSLYEGFFIAKFKKVASSF
jgi:16S rRNA (cytosine1407-C5)-methyltransferase